MVASSNEENCIDSQPSSRLDKTLISTLNQQELGTLLISGIDGQNQASSFKSSVKDSLKRKLTARVAPMSRNDNKDLHKSLDEESRGGKKAMYNGERHNCNTNGLPTVTTAYQTTSLVPTTTSVIVKTEKSDMSTCGGSTWTGNAQSLHHRVFTGHELHAKQKCRPTQRAMPATMVPLATSQPLLPLNPEPKLLGENIATLSLLTASQGHLATLQDDDGDTPLHIAIAQGQVPLVKHLISIISTSGMSLDIYNKLKQTPLHVAVITNQPLITRILINAGVDANVPDRNGRTAIHLACQRSTIECLMELVRCRYPINLETENYTGLTPMHEAVMSNSPDIIRYLINCGAKVDSKDGKSGRTPLHYAVEQELLSVIELLVHFGANGSAATLSGSTPIQTASGRGMSHITRLLSESNTEASGRSSRYRFSSSSNSSSKARGTTSKK